MKKSLLLPLIVLVASFANAQDVNMPQPSPTEKLVQNFGIGKIELTYSRPSLKGRTVFDDNSTLAPYGKVWRTGANGATTIVFDEPVTFGGKKLDTGSYAILTMPGKSEWTVMVTKGIDKSFTEYKQEDDVARFTVTPQKANTTTESFTMQFVNLKNQSCDLQLSWGNTVVNIPIVIDIKDKLRAQIEEAMKTANKPYYIAANFYYEWMQDYPKALDNINAALMNNQDAYFMYFLKAKIEKAMGKTADAKASAQKCIDAAQKAGNPDYVQQANAFIKSL